MKKLLALVALLCALLGALPLQAATMAYVAAGNFTASDPTDPTNGFAGYPLVFAGIGDGTMTVDNSNPMFTVYEYGLSDFGVTDGYGFTDFGSGYSFLAAPAIKAVGFGNSTGLLFAISLPISYSGTGNYFPVSFSGLYGSENVTVLGDPIHFDNVTNGTFLAFSVPETATWGMFLIGFGLLGVAVRREQRWDGRPQTA